MSSYANFQQDSQEPAPKKKDNSLKILLIVLGIGGGVVVLSCAGCLVAAIMVGRNAFSDDPAKVRQTANAITEIDVPAGYDPLFSMNMFFKMAAFGPEGQQGGEALILMAFPEGMANEAEMRQQMNVQMQQQGQQQNLQQLDVETRTYTIRGTECAVQIAKVESEDGRAFRQCTAIFVAKDGGPAMLMFMMSEEDWNDGGREEFERMLASMK